MTGPIKVVFGLVAVGVVAVALINPPDSLLSPEKLAARYAQRRDAAAKAEVAAQDAEVERKRKDGENRRFTAEVYAVRGLKRTMKNPDSFKLVTAQRMLDGTLCLHYRATNSFNAVIPGAAVITQFETVTSDQSDKFQKTWKSKCAGRTGSDVSHIDYALKTIPE